MRPETQMDHNNKRKSKKSSLFGKMKQATACSKNYETFHTVCDSASYQGEGSKPNGTANDFKNWTSD